MFARRSSYVLAAVLLAAAVCRGDQRRQSKASSPAPVPSSEASHIYKNSWNSVARLAREIYRGLPADQRERINSQPVALETDVRPFVKLEVYLEEGKRMPMIFISIGFIDLVNNLAHAKAIDNIEKGYFANYIRLLARESGDKELAPLPHVEESKYWNEDIMNEQSSNFNSIAGIIIGINMAHHFLGQFDKYQPEICDLNGNSKPITTVLSISEYDAAFKAGVKTALNGGCTIEGAIPFFEAFDKMPVRPAWAPYFLPKDAGFAKLKSTMKKSQENFFHGKD